MDYSGICVQGTEEWTCNQRRIGSICGKGQQQMGGGQSITEIGKDELRGIKMSSSEKCGAGKVWDLITRISVLIWFWHWRNRLEIKYTLTFKFSNHLRTMQSQKSWDLLTAGLLWNLFIFPSYWQEARQKLCTKIRSPQKCFALMNM